ncbi:hypothetical protein PL335_17470 (plasmid) [Sulfitobacter faviae]|uniref:hypothetical protein n=1 Tax=Sulfitobacter faviae TaxID=1775881 RepID=UPI00230835A7|nr:hypothetical protein [Sulfitobacter faviae]WCE68744.1 hypothetical protein PL335_17470 [Sulfitobacter faviae]
MTLDDIKAAVDAGQTVHWANTGYVVHKDRLGQYLITYVPNGSCIGLTDRGGHQLNGKEAEFFIARMPIRTRRARPICAARRWPMTMASLLSTPFTPVGIAGARRISITRCIWTKRPS